MHASLNSRQASDRRKYLRTPVNGALDLRASGIEIPITAGLKDISPGGCAIDCRVALNLTHPLRMQFPLPGAKPMMVDGNVVRKSTTTSDKMNHYGVQFRVETAALRDNLKLYIAQYCRPVQNNKIVGPDRRTRGATIDAKFSVTISAPDVRPFNVMAITLGTEGIRVASDRVLRQEWSMRLELRLPGAIIAGPPLQVNGHAKPGAKSVRGSFVQDIVFVQPSLHVITEIERAMSDIAAKARRAS
jgi:hypothetical protein